MFIKCPKCSENFAVGLEDLKELKCSFDGTTYRVLCFDCIVCKTRIFVQVDDDVSLQKLEQCKILLRKIMKMRHHKQKVGKKLLDDFKKGRFDLGNYRTKLVNKLTGMTLVNAETGEIYERFTLYEN